MTAVVLPVVASAVATAFSVRLGRQYAARRRGHALAWCLSLAMYALASAAVAVGVAGAWGRAVFGVYWLAGALLNVPLLAAGQLLLVDPRRASLWWGLAALLAVVALGSLVTADFDASALAEAGAAGTIPLGRQVLDGSPAYALARPYSLTFAVVVVGSAWSALRTRRWGPLLVAAGVTVVAASSAAVRVGRGQLFSVLLVVGVVIMYAGFRSSTRTATAGRRS
ncbi:MAG: hypothetical protein KY434_05815 [Actinobacteria bacterium]|nr:hypothetical protein [Actinomycetota bacterium]